MSDKKNWADKEEVGVYWLMRFTLFLRMYFGNLIFRIILIPVVTWYFLFSRPAREASLDYLHHVYAAHPSPEVQPNWKNSFRHFMAFAQAMMDKLTAWSGKLSIGDVEVHGREEFIQSVSGKSGALILGGHLGNTEVTRALASIHKRAKLNILVHTKHAQNFNRLLNDVSGESQMELIQVTDVNPAVAIMLEEKIALGEFVFIVGDRIPVSNNARTLEAPFLGENAPFAQGPFILGSLLKCPVYTLFCLKQKGRYHIYFEHFADRIILPRKNREAAIKTYIDSYAQRLERYCLMAPMQWFNFYHYWQLPVYNENSSPNQKA